MPDLDAFDVFDPDDRQIFRYHDGTNKRRGDPIRIDRRFRDALGGNESTAIFDAMQSDDRDIQDAALVQFAKAAYEALEIPPLDDQDRGLTEEEIVNTMSRFFEFQAAAKKKGGTSPSGSPATDGPPADPSPMLCTTPST